METQTKESNPVDANPNASSEGQVYPPNPTSQTQPTPSETANRKEEQSSVSSVYLEPEEEKAQASTQQVDAIKDSAKKKYHNIPNDTRLQLIDAVENKGEKIKHVKNTLFLA